MTDMSRVHCIVSATSWAKISVSRFLLADSVFAKSTCDFES